MNHDNISCKSMKRRSKAVGFALFACLCALAATAQTPTENNQRDELDYQLLAQVAVQDYGFEKTLYTFASERIELITGKPRFEGHRPVELLLAMTFDQQTWASHPLMKVYHPELIELFELKRKQRDRISHAEFFDSATLPQLQQLAQSPRSVSKAVNGLYRQAMAFEELELNLALIPREGLEWLSPAEPPVAAGEEQTTEAQLRAAYASLRNSFLQQDAAGFNETAAEFAQLNREAFLSQGGNGSRLSVDFWNTRINFFRRGFQVYLLATLLYLALLIFRWPALSRPALGMLIFGLVLHTVGLIARTILVGRAPVANFYESFVFAIAGVILIAIVIDIFYRNRVSSFAALNTGLGGFCGALLGFVLLVIAVKLPVHESQLKPLMPALQSTWLTYHVITIMLSYAAFALSFLVSAYYLAYSAYAKLHNPAGKKIKEESNLLIGLDFFNYRIIAIGFPLLSIGIITGAVWANTAWGRPWFWDPKETWSAITWLIYGVYLHMRFLPWGRGFWSAIFSIIGFAAVIFTYLGVNYLLSGLHSYAG